MTWRSLVASLWPAADNYFRRRAEVRAREDLPYLPDGHAKHRLDLLVPSGEGPFPVVVFLHGGLWNTQDRKLLRVVTGLYANVGVALACEGFAVAIPSLRQDAPAHTEDDARAVLAWLRAHAAEHALDVDALSLVGHSAGGALAHTLANDPDARAVSVRAVASLNAVYDLRRLVAASPGAFQKRARTWFRDESAMERLSPERRVGASSVPALLVTSTGDDRLLQAEHTAFTQASQTAGARHEVLSIAGPGHMGLVMEVGRTHDRVTAPLARFLSARCVDTALPEGHDVTRLLARVMNPQRPRLEAARAAVATARTGDEALERTRAAGLLPAAWASTTKRCFSRFVACPACGGSGHGDHGGPCLRCFRKRVVLAPPGDAPPSLAATVAIASLGPETLDALEAHAWRAAEALRPWKTTPPFDHAAPTRVCWCVVSAGAWRLQGHGSVEPARYADAACEAAGVSPAALVRAFERAHLPKTLDDDAPVIAAWVDAANALTWRRAVGVGLAVPALRGAPEGNEHLVGRAFATLPDPFEARCAAWAMGCALDDIERDGTVVVVVPG